MPETSLKTSVKTLQKMYFEYFSCQLTTLFFMLVTNSDYLQMSLIAIVETFFLMHYFLVVFAYEKNIY